MNLSQRKVNTFLYAVQGVGAVFVAVFLAAYLAGLPTTAVLHLEPAVRLTLAVLGILLLALILVSIVLAAYYRKINRSLE